MSTAPEVFAAVKTQILAVVVDKRAAADRLVYWAGSRESCPDHDRHFTLDPISHPRDFTRGCNRKKLEIDLTVRYTADTQGEYKARYLADADEISDTIYGLTGALPSTIRATEEVMTVIDEFAGMIHYQQIFAVTYQDTGA